MEVAEERAWLMSGTIRQHSPHLRALRKLVAVLTQLSSQLNLNFKRCARVVHGCRRWVDCNQTKLVSRSNVC